MTAPTSLQSLIEERLIGVSLAEFVATRYAARRSWDDMADELSDLTGVPVSRESLRRWYAARLRVEVRVA